MTVYIALLRGINVGGKHIIKMHDLKRVLETIGLCDVQTYIQSGNVLFKSNEEKESLQMNIKHAVETAFGFSITIILKTAQELQQIIKNFPFSEKEVLEAELSSEVQTVYIALLANEPLYEKIQQLDIYRTESDEYRIMGREVYLLFHHSIRNSKLANNLHRLDVSMTMRNWKTINKLAVLAKAKDD